MATDAKAVFMFSGQGSHYPQMGRALFDHAPVFPNRMLLLDRIVQRLGADSVIDALYANGRRKGDTLDRTVLTHPAIFMVEVALAELLIDVGVVPDITLGCSWGRWQQLQWQGSSMSRMR